MNVPPDIYKIWHFSSISTFPIVTILITPTLKQHHCMHVCTHARTHTHMHTQTLPAFITVKPTNLQIMLVLRLFRSTDI